MAEAAMLAGLPKAPSSFNPVVNPKRAKTRQLYVLGRLHKLNHISEQEFKQLEKQPVPIAKQSREFAMPADYVAEMARQVVYDRLNEEAYSRGIKVYTTIRQSDQQAAYQALRTNVLEYDKRRGYRGPEAYIDLLKYETDQEKALEEALGDFSESENVIPAVVLAINNNEILVYTKEVEILQIKPEGLKFVEKYLQ